MAGIHLEWEWDGLDRVTDKIDNIADALQPPQLTEIMGKGADMFVGYAKQHAPKKSGALANSIDKTQIGDTDWAISPYVNPGENEKGVSIIEYAGVQESGSTHGPKDADYLVFQGESGWVYAKEVTIPGVHYMEIGFLEGQQYAIGLVKQEINKVVED